MEFINYLINTFAETELSTIILIGLSGFLGKVWTEKLIGKESRKNSEALEGIRNELRIKSEKQLAAIHHEFEILSSRNIREHNDKLVIYRNAIDNIVVTLAKLELVVLNKRQALSVSELEAFGTERLRVYGYLGMLAPQDVMNANDNLTDLLLGVVHQNKQTDWETIRSYALELINAIRRDIGLDKTEIQYMGER